MTRCCYCCFLHLQPVGPTPNPACGLLGTKWVRLELKKKAKKEDIGAIPCCSGQRQTKKEQGKNREREEKKSARMALVFALYNWYLTGYTQQVCTTVQVAAVGWRRDWRNTKSYQNRDRNTRQNRDRIRSTSDEKTGTKLKLQNYMEGETEEGGE